MKNNQIDDFKFWCSEIHSLLSIPRGIKPKSQEYKKYERLLNSEKEKSEQDIDYIKKMDDKIAILNDPPLSKTAINALVKKYGRIVYNKKTASTGDPMAFLKKGTDMEVEAVELLSKIDKADYSLVTENTENDYLLGRCDIYCPQKDKVIDTKVSWNVNSFLNSRTTKFSPKYWYQMQGYMELYNVNEAEVVFLLLNTPPELIEREKIKIVNKFMIGEIDRDKYELDIENIESAFTYSSIPLKKRHFRYKIKREPQVFSTVYKKVEKARVWLRQFEQDMKTNIFVLPSDNYVKQTEEDNTECDTTEPSSDDTGG
jgi:hypothetical protein